MVSSGPLEAELSGARSGAPPLAGLRVLDLGHHIAAPYGTRLLAACGAHVVKLERPRSGDLMRWIGPFAGDEPGADRGLAFLDLNVNKLGITLNLACATGRELMLELVRASDIVVESFRPGTLERFGLGYDSLARVNPAIVLTSVSNFGQSGPYRDMPASELVLYAMGHAMHGTGHIDASPASVAPRLDLALAGHTAAVGAMAAALGAGLHGQGDWIDVSIMETMLSSIDRRADSLTAFAYSGDKFERARWDEDRMVPSTYSRCSDGWVVCSHALTPATWAAFVRGVGDPWWEDPRFVPPLADDALRTELRERWATWCSEHTKVEITERMQTAGFSCAPVNAIDAVVNDPALEARGYFADVEHPLLGTVRHPGLFAKFADTPGRIVSPAPRLGEHNALVYGELGLDREDLAALAAAGVI